jgi:hypothetical protein
MSPVHDTGPGKSRLFRGHELLKAYPDFSQVVTSGSFALELSNYDIASADLKKEHEVGLWELGLKAFDRDFTSVNVWGFHSHTGDPRFNARLAEQRAEKAMYRVKILEVIDARVRRWNYRGVAWRHGMKDGESPEMRKVLLLFRGESFNDWASLAGHSKEKQLR